MESIPHDKNAVEVATAPAEPVAAPEAATVNWPLRMIAAIAVVAALYFGQDLLIPLLLAGLISYALDPIHRRLVAWKIPTALSAAMLVVGVIGLLVAGGFAIHGQASAFVDQLPSLTEKLRESLRNGGGGLGSSVQPVQEAAAELRKAAEGPVITPPDKDVTRVQVEQAPFKVSDLLWRGTLSVFAIAGQLTMVLFLVYYLLASGDQYKRKLVRVIGPSLFRKRLTVDILNEITAQIGRFIVARIVISGIVGTATGLAMWGLGLSQPAVWGFAAGVLNNVPYVGPFTAVGAIALGGLVQFGTPGMAGVVGAAAGLIAAIEGLVITPWLMGKAGRMNTGMVFVSLMFWGWVWGLWGLLFAVPIMMAIKAVCDHIPEFDFVSEFLRE